MKKRYKNLLRLFVIEILILSMMKDNDIKVQSWIGNAIATVILLLPIQILFFLLSKDKNISQRKQKVFQILFWYINICWILGAIGALL